MTVPDGWGADPIGIVRYPSGNIKYIGISGFAPKTEIGKGYGIQVLRPNGDRTNHLMAYADVHIRTDGHFVGQYGWALGKAAPDGAAYTYEIYAMLGRALSPAGPPIYRSEERRGGEEGRSR